MKSFRFERWLRTRAEKKARRKSPRYHELAQAYEGHENVLSSDSLGLTVAMWMEKSELLHSLNPLWSSYVRLPGWWRRHSPGHYIREVRYFIQRGRRGFSDCDLWSLDSYLSEMLPNAIWAFQKNLHSHPHDLTEGEWEAILQEMANGIAAARDKFEPRELDLVKLDRGLELFRQHFLSLWD